MDLKDTYDRIAEDWYKDHKADDWWVEGTDAFVSLLKPGSSVLDVGCGAGLKSGYLSSKGLKPIGIDFSEKFIEIARRDIPRCNFMVMDMRDVVKLGRKFDGVFVQASLLHIPKKDASNVIGALTSVLLSGGYLYVAVKGLRGGDLEERVIKEHDYGYSYERFFSFYTMPELERYMADNGLQIIFKDAKINGRTEWLQIIARK